MSSNQVANPSLWHNHNFNIFWAGRTINAFGDSFAMLALPLFVLEATSSVAQMGLTTGISGIGGLASGILSGAIVDRVDRRRLLIACDAGRVLAYGLLPATWWLVGPVIGLVYFVAAVAAFLATGFWITYTSAIPGVVNPDQIVEANGRLQATIAVAYVLGPVSAGFACHRLGFTLAIAIVMVSYAASSSLMFLVRLPQMAKPGGRIRLTRHVLFAEFLEGARFLLGHPILKPIMILLALSFFLSEATIDLSIFHLKQDLGHNDNAVGIVFGIASLGAVMAGGLISSLNHRYGFGFCFLGVLALQGAAVALIGIAPTIIAPLAAVYTFANTTMRISTLSLRQQITPDHLLGRVSGMFWTFLTVPGAAGVALITFVTKRTGAPLALFLVGSLSVVVAAVGVFTPARARRPEECIAASALAEAGQSGGKAGPEEGATSVAVESV
jgi:MFS family permease